MRLPGGESDDITDTSAIVPSERLRTRVTTVFVLLAIAPLALGAMISLVVSISLTRQESTENQHHFAEITGSLLDASWRTTVGNLRAAASVIGEQTPDPWITATLLREGCPACRTIWVLDTGEHVGQVLGRPEPPPALSPAVRTAITRGDEAIPSASPLDSPAGQLLLAFPLRSHDAHHGMLLALLDLQQLGETALNVAQTEHNAYAYVVDPAGRLIISPRPQAEPAGRDMRAVPIVAAALQGEEWVLPRSQAYDGLLAPRVDGAWYRMPSTGWYIVVEVPLSISTFMNWYLFTLETALLLLTAVVALLLGRRLAATITLPIERLQQGVARLGAGKWSQPLAIGRPDEIGMLAAAFNGMALDLLTKRQELEDRSRDLALANTDLERALAEARAADMLKTQFVAAISHELRTPLTAVLGFSEMLQLGMYGPLDEEQLDVIDRIGENGKHLLQLINDLLDFSKLEAGKMNLYEEDVSPHALIVAAINSFEPQARAKNLSVEARFDPALPHTLRGDSLRLRQILLNLFSNALKFTDVGGVIVSARYDARDGQLEIDVEDTGIGIAPEDQTHIFDAFRQVDGSYARRRDGTGLGLAITQRLVGLMAGAIALTSEPGRGSRFTVTLPLPIAGGVALNEGGPDGS